MNYEKFCIDVIAIDRSIRYASVYNRIGDVVGGGMRKDKVSLLSPEQDKMSLYYSKHMYETRKNLSHIIGKEKYSITEYEKVKMINVPLKDDNLLLISIEPIGDHFKILDQILKMVESHSKQNY